MSEGEWRGLTNEGLHEPNEDGTAWCQCCGAIDCGSTALCWCCVTYREWVMS